MNYNPSTIARIADINLGLRVDKASIAISGISTKAVFTVIGGRILVRALIGQATVAIQNQACAAKFVSIPTLGAVTDMCGVGELQNMAIYGMVSLPGTTIATEMHVTTTTANGAIPACNTGGIFVPAGVIGFNTAASNTGGMKFSIWYVPVDDGAYVEAA